MGLLGVLCQSLLVSVKYLFLLMVVWFVVLFCPYDPVSFAPRCSSERFDGLDLPSHACREALVQHSRRNFAVHAPDHVLLRIGFLKVEEVSVGLSFIRSN